jgi:hypothetical protein
MRIALSHHLPLGPYPLTLPLGPPPTTLPSLLAGPTSQSYMAVATPRPTDQSSQQMRPNPNLKASSNKSHLNYKLGAPCTSRKK